MGGHGPEKKGLTLVCKGCSQEFYVPQCRAGAEYCSQACRRIPTITCVACGKLFHVPPVRASAAKYCSQKCHFGNREAATRITKNCKQCGKEFQSWQSQNVELCSYACKNKFQSKQEERICAYCEKPFEIKRTAFDKCCSWRCRVAKGRAKAWAQGLRGKRQCWLCKKSFEITPSTIDHWDVWFCSLDCYEKSPHIQHAPWRQEFRFRSEWARVRKQVRKRDGNACTKCGFAGKGLHVHHIVEKQFGGTEDLNNLTTLCKTCHDKEHGHKGELSWQEQQS